MISKIKIETAKKAELPIILENLGIKLTRNGGGYQSVTHDSLKIFKRDGVWLYKWWSRDGEVGDGIQYLQRYCNMSFVDAIEYLTGDSVTFSGDQVEDDQSEIENWQQKSKKLIKTAHNNLLGFKPNGKEGLKYFIDVRGLRIETIKRFQLGFLPNKDHMPSKLVIPCYNSKKKLIRIRFRILNPSQGLRYRVSKGSDASGPFPIGVSPNKPLIIVESELDAILIAQEAGDLVGVIGLGTASVNMRSDAIYFLNEKIPLVLICMDNDSCGRTKAINLIKKITHAVDWPVPERYGKDPGEAWHKMDLRQWVNLGLNSVT